MKPLLLAIFMLLATPLHAYDPDGGLIRVNWDKVLEVEGWTTTDTVLMASFIAVRLADWSQTLQIEDHPGLEETNKMLGTHPDRQEINVFFPVTTLAMAGAAAIMPRGMRRSFLLGCTLVNGAVVVSNDRLGLKVGFRR